MKSVGVKNKITGSYESSDFYLRFVIYFNIHNTILQTIFYMFPNPHQTSYGSQLHGICGLWYRFSSNNSHHTSCIQKGSHAGKWPDLMISKPDSVSTLGYHWTDHTARPLEPQIHWEAIGTTLADASTQWCSSGDPVLICIIGTHWKTTRATSTLGCHWNHNGWC